MNMTAFSADLNKRSERRLTVGPELSNRTASRLSAGAAAEIGDAWSRNERVACKNRRRDPSGGCSEAEIPTIREGGLRQAPRDLYSIFCTCDIFLRLGAWAAEADRWMADAFFHG
jgi:hypothetical protein